MDNVDVIWKISREKLVAGSRINMGNVDKKWKNLERSLLQDREGTDSSLSWADDVS